LGKGFNKKMLFNFLTIGYTDNPTQPDETFYDDVKKLPAASFLKIRIQSDILIEIEKYWDIDIEEQEHNISDDDAIARFNELFKRQSNED
jgi:asparagine synthase (glutamine-hydrolysing)